MSDAEDYELQREDLEPPEETPRRSIGLWIVAVILMVAGAAAIYITYSKRGVHTSLPPPTPMVREQPARPLGGEAEPIALPPLDESDAVVRALVRAMSNHPGVTAWLATNDLVRNFTAAVSNIAEGTSPAKQLSTLRPRS